MLKSNSKAVVLFTGKSVEHILKDGGTQSWKLDPERVRHTPIAVLCRSGVNWAEGSEPAGSAFLVGLVSDVVPSDETGDRYLIRFSEFARIEKLEVWKGWRNPVRYSSVNDLDIDLNILEFEPMPGYAAPADEVVASAPRVARSKPLSIAEAKDGLAAKFNVPPENIDIRIRW